MSYSSYVSFPPFPLFPSSCRHSNASLLLGSEDGVVRMYQITSLTPAEISNAKVYSTSTTVYRFLVDVHVGLVSFQVMKTSRLVEDEQYQISQLNLHTMKDVVENTYYDYESPHSGGGGGGC